MSEQPDRQSWDGMQVTPPVTTFATPPGQTAALWRELCQAQATIRQRDAQLTAYADNTARLTRERDEARAALAGVRGRDCVCGFWAVADALLARHAAADHGRDCHCPECHPPSQED